MLARSRIRFPSVNNTEQIANNANNNANNNAPFIFLVPRQPVRSVVRSFV